MSQLRWYPADPLAGVPFMMMAMLIFAGNDAVAKYLAGLYAVAQLLAIRGFAGLVLIAPQLHRNGWRRSFIVPRPWLHGLRVALLVAELALFYAAVRAMPLAECLTVYQAMPLFATALSVFVLGERVGWRRWTAVLAGFAGVVLVLEPDADGISWPALMALVGTVLYAGVNVLTRLLRDAGPEALIGWHSLGTFVVTAAIAPFVWVPIGWEHFLLAVVLGLSATIAHIMLNKALSLSPTAVLMPFHYTMIVWGMLLGWYYFDEIPDWQMLVGAAIIVASGLYVIYRERKVRANSAAV